MKSIGLDVGYSETKAKDKDGRVSFASVVGTADKAHWSLAESATIILTEPGPVQIGEGAVSQSRFLRRREDRGWIESDEWYALFLAALSELAKGSFEARVVTGLPVAFYDDGKVLRDRLLGRHRLQREGRRVQTVEVTDCRVIPQPFGALLSVCLNDRGQIVDGELASGAVGVMDVGGKTTNLLSVNRLSEIGRETASVNVGAWDTIRAMREWLTVHCPNLDLRDHQVIDAVISRQVKYYGEVVDLSGPVDEVLEPLAEQVLAEATQLWNGAAALDAILVSGGGALLLGDYVRRHFRHARVIEDAVFANAVGFWRFAERLARS